MRFDHDNMTGVRLSVALLNLEADGAWTADSVHRTLIDQRIRRPEVTDDVVARIHAWTTVLRPIFEAATVEIRCERVNALLATSAGGVYLSTHDGRRPHLHFTPESDDLLGRIRAVTSGGLAVFAVETGGERLGLCAHRPCRRVFADTTRGGRQSYCSPRCANTEAVRRHRNRT